MRGAITITLCLKSLLLLLLELLDFLQAFHGRRKTPRKRMVARPWACHSAPGRPSSRHPHLRPHLGPSFWYTRPRKDSGSPQPRLGVHRTLACGFILGWSSTFSLQHLKPVSERPQSSGPSWNWCLPSRLNKLTVYIIIYIYKVQS